MAKLFLDDVRNPPDSTWTVARSAPEAVELIRKTQFDEMSLDHDLGQCDACSFGFGCCRQCGCPCHLTGYYVVCVMESENLWPKERPIVHSMNPVGGHKMVLAINRAYSRHCERSEQCADDVYCNCPCGPCRHQECLRPGCRCSRRHTLLGG